MLAVTEPGVHVITLMVCTQLMKTAFIENVVGYHAHLDPCPMLLVQPKDEAVEAFSKERITPLIRSTPALRKLIGSKSSRSAEETLTYKAFPGGFLAMVGAGSPDNLARRPVRITLYDETDKYIVTREGDPIGLGDERQATFAQYLSVRCCSPTIAGESRIESSYLDGDQRQASVACPHCEHRNFLEFFRHVHWDTDPDTGIHYPKTAQIYCEACGSGWSEGERLQSLATTRWHQTRPFLCCGTLQDPLKVYEAAWQGKVSDPVAAAWDWWEGPRHAVYRARCGTCGKWAVDNEHASFQAGKLFSPWPKDAPDKQAAKWLAAKDDPDQRVVFDNTQRGMPHKRDTGRDIKPDALAARAEKWAGEVPHGVGVITAGLDTQDDRVEIEFVGWGRGEESWTLAYVVVEGDTSTDELWARVDEQLLRTFRRDDGREFAIDAACIDSGGHRTNEVYHFARARAGRNVWAIKGANEQGGQRRPVWPSVKPARRDKSKAKPILIGTSAAKDTIRSRLALDVPGPGYCHFHAQRELGWYEQLLAERLILKVKGGKRYSVWDCPKGRANEALDCRVYAYAALQGLVHLGLRLDDRVDEMVGIYIPPAPTEPVAETRSWGNPEAGDWVGGGQGAWL